jgi:hypothetical protein
VRGMPFGYSSTTGEPEDVVCYDAAADVYSAAPITPTFQTAAVWFDLIVYGAVLTAAYMLVDKVRT